VLLNKFFNFFFYFFNLDDLFIELFFKALNLKIIPPYPLKTILIQIFHLSI
jgi:hypothetical protein